MSSRTRMMGAGNASSTVYKTNVNLNTFGGNKKQGITSRVGLDNWANLAVQTYSNGYGKNKLFCMNQLGGVGAGKSMFNGRFTRVDGVHCPVSQAAADTGLTLRITNLDNIGKGVPLPPGYSYLNINIADTTIIIPLEYVTCDPNEVIHISVEGTMVDIVGIFIDHSRGDFVIYTYSGTLPSSYDTANIGILSCL